MPGPFTIVTELENITGVETEIKEHRRNAPEGLYSDIITLAPNQRREVGARKFRQRCVDSLRPSVLKIFVGGADTGRELKPLHFIVYTRIVFELGENQQLVITGFRDHSSFVYRLRGLRFLLGRNNYQGMQGEEIA